jgi:hypothetical protein
VQTGLPIGVTDPSKLFAQPFVACHETVKGQNDEGAKMFLFFPTTILPLAHTAKRQRAAYAVIS